MDIDALLVPIFFSPLSASNFLDRVRSLFSGPDPYYRIDIGNEYFPMADFSRACAMVINFDHLGRFFIGNKNLEFAFGKKSTEYSAPR